MLFYAHSCYCNLHDVNVFDNDYIIVWCFLSFYSVTLWILISIDRGYILRRTLLGCLSWQWQSLLCLTNDKCTSVQYIHTHISLDLLSWLRARFSNINASVGSTGQTTIFCVMNAFNVCAVNVKIFSIRLKFYFIFSARFISENFDYFLSGKSDSGISDCSRSIGRFAEKNIYFILMK